MTITLVAFGSRGDDVRIVAASTFAARIEQHGLSGASRTDPPITPMYTD